MTEKIKQLIIHSAPLAFGIILSYLFWKWNILLLIVYVIAALLLILIGKDRQVELWILIFGIIAGFAVETIGTQLSGYQSFTNPDIFGIPYWLIVVWGYGFVLMKRISLIMATESPWLRQ